MDPYHHILQAKYVVPNRYDKLSCSLYAYAAILAAALLLHELYLANQIGRSYYLVSSIQASYV